MSETGPVAEFEPAAVREAIRALESIIRKNEKAKLKLKEESWQHRRTERTLAAARIAVRLLREELDDEREGAASVVASKAAYPADELRDAWEQLTSLSEQVAGMLPKFAAGSSQHTLAIRRIAALELAAKRIRTRSEAE